MDKHALSERDICTKFITPALRQAGWDEITQIREEVSFTKGRIIVRGKLVSRGKGKRADYIHLMKVNISPVLIVALQQLPNEGQMNLNSASADHQSWTLQSFLETIQSPTELQRSPA